MNSVLWVTAFRDLQRENWGVSPRPFDEYLQSFAPLTKLSPHLVCFADEPHASIIREKTGFDHIFPYDVQDTFIPRYTARQKEIIESVEYKKKLPGFLWPGFTHAEWGTVNYSKVCFVRRAAKMFPGYTHYAWIDFGFVKKPGEAPPDNFVPQLLSDKIMVRAYRHFHIDEAGNPMLGEVFSTEKKFEPHPWNNPDYMLHHCIYGIHGNVWVIPVHLIEWFEQSIERSIQMHLERGIANHDEPLWLPIIYEFPKRFHIDVKSGVYNSWDWITEDTWGSFTVAKKDGELVYKSYGCDSQRNDSLFWCIQQADKVYNWNDFSERRFYTNDYETVSNSWSITSASDCFDRTVPDFVFHNWIGTLNRDYDEVVQTVSDAGLEPFTVNKVGWIGKHSHDYRLVLMDIAKQNPDLFDCTLMDWGPDWKTPSKFVSLEDLARTYSVMLDIEGYGYSARVKYLLWSRRPLLLVDREHKEYYYKWLMPWEHYIPVKHDMSDLVEKTRWCLDNYEQAKRIAENAYEFSRKYLTREACYSRWNEILQPTRILWVTAFKDFGRHNWTVSQRSENYYFERFEEIRHLDPVCFTDDPRVVCERKYPFEEHDTFFGKNDLYHRHMNILNSPEFWEKCPEHRKWDAPEFTYPEYSLMCFSKTSFLRRASEMFPGYTHYAWIDFGFAKTPEACIPSYQDVPRDQIYISSCRMLTFTPENEPAYGAWGSNDPQQANPEHNWNNPQLIVKHQHWIIQANSYLVPKHMTHWLEQQMEYAVERHYELGIVGHDEPIFHSIIHDFPQRFKVNIKTEWTGRW